MLDRGFSEVDLRLMMETARMVEEDVQPGRWIVRTVHDSSDWDVIIEPDFEEQLLVVITAYRVD